MPTSCPPLRRFSLRHDLLMVLLATAACEAPDPAPFPGAVAPQAKTFEGDALIENADDVARWSGYARITGDLMITPESGLTTVTLERLKRVDGNILVQGVFGFGQPWTLSMPLLTHVGRDLAVTGSDDVVIVDAPSLGEVGGHLRLEEAIVSVPLPELTAVHGDLRLTDLTLVDLSLDALTWLGGGLRAARFSGGAEVDRVVLSLPLLEAIGTDVRLERGSLLALEAPRLATVAGDFRAASVSLELLLPALRSLGGGLSLRTLDLHRMEAPLLAEMAGDLELADVSVLADGIFSLPSLQSVGQSVRVHAVGGMSELILDTLAAVGGAVAVTDCGALSGVRLTHLEALPSDLILKDNGSLGVQLPRLATVGGDLELVRNGGTRLHAEALREVEGDLEIIGTTLELVSLPLLERVGRSLRLTWLTMATPAVELPALVEVGGDLEVSTARFLERVSAPALEAIGDPTDEGALGHCVLEDNQDLTTVSLTKLGSVAGDLRIRRNPELPGEAVQAAFGAVMVGGERAICGNGGEEPPCL